MPNTHHIEQARRGLKHVERAIPWLTLVAAPVGVFLVIRSQRDAISAIDWTISWEPLAVSVLAFALAPLMQGLSFWLVLRFLTGTTPLSDAMLVWGRSYVVRYAPTGALAIACRLSARLGVSLVIRVVNIAGELLAVLLVHGLCAIGACGSGRVGARASVRWEHRRALREAAPRSNRVSDL